MPIRSVDELLRYAPDGRALEGARRLFFSRRWRLLAGDGRWIWGEFSIDNNKALLAAVNLLHAEFHCSCRSRRRPCVHTLALLLKLKNRPGEWTVSEPPNWVKKLGYEGGDGVLPQVGSSSDGQASPPPREGMQPSALTSSLSLSPERLQLMKEGLAELELRLLDLMRSGLADADQLGAELWQEIAARLTDAKLAGLAGRYRWLAARIASEESPITGADILRLVGDSYLLCRAWPQLDEFEAARQIEYLRLLGLNPKREQVLLQRPRADLWLVMGSEEGQEERLRHRRVWLRGERSKRYALIIDYAYGDQAFERSWPLASAWYGELYYYPGLYPRRALLPHTRPADRVYQGLRPYEHYREMMNDFTRALTLQPWLADYPAYLSGLYPRFVDGRPSLVDGQGIPYPLQGSTELFDPLLAAAGCETVTLFALFDGMGLRPLSLWTGTSLQKL